MEFILVTKNCSACGSKFKVGQNSKQKFCSLYCTSTGEVWDEHLKDSSEEEPETEIVSVSKEWTPILEKKNEKEKRSTGIHIPKKKKIVRENTMNLIKKSEMLNENNGARKIESVNSNIKENTTDETSLRNVQKFMKTEKTETHTTGLSLPSTHSSAEISHSMNLIRESTLLLRDHMTSCKADPDGELNLSTKIEKINLACKCAGEIAKLLKVQVEAVKAFNNIK